MKVVGCFLEYDGKFLILLRHAHKPNGASWGLPAGKVETGETEDFAMTRELHEETGYLVSPHELEHLGTFRFKHAHRHYSFSAYRLMLDAPYTPLLEPQAHVACKWVTGTECYAIQTLIPDFHELLKLLKYVP